MATKNLLSQLVNADTLKGIAKATGIDASDVTSVLSQAVPALLEGANKQATGAKTAAGFAQALASHAGVDTTSLASFFKNVDLEDGAKIVSHLVGNTTTLSNKVSKSTGVSKENVAAILSAVAPLLLTVVGKQTKANGKKAETSTVTDLASQLLGSVDTSALVSGLLSSATGKKTGNKTSSTIDAEDVVNLLGKLIKK